MQDNLLPLCKGSVTAEQLEYLCLRQVGSPCEPWLGLPLRRYPKVQRFADLRHLRKGRYQPWLHDSMATECTNVQPTSNLRLRNILLPLAKGRFTASTASLCPCGTSCGAAGAAEARKVVPKGTGNPKREKGCFLFSFLVTSEISSLLYNRKRLTLPGLKGSTNTDVFQ